MRTRQRRTLRDIRAGLEAAGIAFIDDGADGGGPGVRLREPMAAAGMPGADNGTGEDADSAVGRTGGDSDRRSRPPD